MPLFVKEALLVAPKVFAVRYEQVDDTTSYIGEGEVGTLDSATTWRIKKIVTDVDGNITITWAGGTAYFNKEWDERLNYTYS